MSKILKRIRHYFLARKAKKELDKIWKESSIKVNLDCAKYQPLFIPFKKKNKAPQKLKIYEAEWPNKYE